MSFVVRLEETNMYKNMENFSLGKDIVNVAKNLIAEGIYVEEIQPFCIDSLNKLSENDIIVNMAGMFSYGISFLKPTTIYFTNNSYVLGHKLVGSMYSLNGHYFFENVFEGFTCLTIRGKFYGDILEPKKYTDSFILKCKPNKYSNVISVVPDWLKYCEDNSIKTE